MTEPRVLLGVFAHPDDETFAAGTFARYADAGVRTVVAIATGGEAGEISDPALATPETLGAVRADELAGSVRAIGIARLVMLGYRDSGMATTPENQHPDSFHQADLDGATRRVVELIRAERPQVVICPDERGDYGHPDHLKAHLATVAAFAAAGDPTRYPDAGTPWTPSKLYYAAFPRSRMEGMRAEMEKLGIEVPFGRRDRVDVEGRPVEMGTPDELVTTTIDVSDYADRKRASIQAHRTQFGVDHFLNKLPEDAFRRVWAQESFRRVAGPGGASETDLFAGL
jgi:LmbE family N-acetylglucosaminyl deacetylase